MDTFDKAVEMMDALTTRQRPLAVEKWPVVVEILEEWVRRRQDGAKVSVQNIVHIINTLTEYKISPHNVRGWLERYHRDLVGEPR